MVATLGRSPMREVGFIKEAGPQKKPLKEINFKYDECIFIVEYYSLF